MNTASPTSHGTAPVTLPVPAEDSGDEQVLISGLLADDPGSWREFNTRYSRLIYRCITRITARFNNVVNAEDVREIYGILCVQLLANDKHKLRSFELGRGNRLGSWLGMLAIHTAYDFLRSVRREPRRGSLLEAEALVSEVGDPFDDCLMLERAGLLGEMMAGLSHKDREFITLYYGEGLEPVEVAARMSISVKTVYSKKHKIQSRLEALLGGRAMAA